jgi:hypothetical protein
MFDLILTACLFSITALVAYRTYRIFVKSPHLSLTESIDLPSGIPVSALGSIECRLAHLKAVLVVADKIDLPKATLAAAVESRACSH